MVLSENLQARGSTKLGDAMFRKAVLGGGGHFG
jgi:hypothetical protein